MWDPQCMCGYCSLWSSHRRSAVSLDQLSFFTEGLAVLELRNHQNKPVMGN